MRKNTHQSDYWDSVARTKNFTHALNWAWANSFINTQSQILDVGCGYGRSLSELAERGFQQLTGIDTSKQMIERGREENPDLNLLWSQSQKFPFADNTFDLVLLFAVLTCIPKSQDQHQLISEIKRVLKPAGKLYLSDNLLNKDERNRSRYEAPLSKYNQYGVFELAGGGIFRHHDGDYLRQSLLSNFQIEMWKEFEVETMNTNRSNAVQLIGSYADK